ncbi:MAG TPA: hypothetical protein GXX25_00520 [Desulfotomaculum sp.]|uniref:hypothetical protein n=1 Tax=Desulfofundulus thermobenzoicus TaxID=29376 RepID=UPI00128F81C2|nr:hypothetical protein [Desulfofundulus thermobenzoicus]HHW42295.1 hypothetical protein [Desulfotomaculum sp.]
MKRCLAKKIFRTAQGKTPYSITDKDKLYSFAGQLKVDTIGSPEQVAVRLADYA